jgi:hypothetical protein
MRKALRGISYANVTATLALVVAMSGGALAASHYVITSKKQIKPSVLRSLEGAPGVRGAQGIPGPAGAPGAPGGEGSPWTAGGTLPPGKTETGTWAAGEEPEGVIEQWISISFPIPLAEKLAEAKVHFVNRGATAPDGCAGGTVEAPAAAPGNLCVYLAGINPIGGFAELRNPEINGVDDGGAGKSGATLIMPVDNAGEGFRGDWAVTAP